MPTTTHRPHKGLSDHDPEAVTWVRKRQLFSQAELARTVGISPSYMCEIEKGIRNAPPSLIRKLATALNCPVAMLERKRDAA